MTVAGECGCSVNIRLVLSVSPMVLFCVGEAMLLPCAANISGEMFSCDKGLLDLVCAEMKQRQLQSIVFTMCSRHT